MGLGIFEETMLHQFIANILLVDYAADCDVFPALKDFIEKINEVKLKGELKYVVGYLERSNKVSKYIIKNDLQEYAIDTLGSFNTIVTAINSLNNKEGLKEVVKSLRLIEYVDHPKELHSLSEYFQLYFDRYNNAGLFPQTFNLLNTITDNGSMVSRS